MTILRIYFKLTLALISSNSSVSVALGRCAKCARSTSANRQRNHERISVLSAAHVESTLGAIGPLVLTNCCQNRTRQGSKCPSVRQCLPFADHNCENRASSSNLPKTYFQVRRPVENRSSAIRRVDDKSSNNNRCSADIPDLDQREAAVCDF